MTYDVVIEERVAQSKIINATDSGEALREAVDLWKNGDVEFKRNDSEVWAATATIRRRGKFDEEEVLFLPDDGLCDKACLANVDRECYQATYIALLQTRFCFETNSLKEAVEIFRKGFDEGRFQAKRLPKSGLRADYVEGELQLDRVYLVPECEFVGRKIFNI